MDKLIRLGVAGALCFAFVAFPYLVMAQEPPVVPPIVVNLPSTGTIDYGQAFGWAQPYVISVVSALVAAAAGWIVYLIQRFLGFSIDRSLSDGYIKNAQNQAAELIAKGFVKIKENGRVEISNQALSAAANDLIKSVPDAVVHFDLKEDEISKKIVAMVPQVPAAPVMIANVATSKPPPSIDERPVR